nr:hypothetical protein [Tanacetum cinerariifolium]
DSKVPSTEEPRVNQEKDANFNNTNNINIVSPTDNAANIEDNAKLLLYQIPTRLLGSVSTKMIFLSVPSRGTTSQWRSAFSSSNKENV